MFGYEIGNRQADRIFSGFTRIFAWGILALFFSMIIAMIYAAWPSIKEFGLPFLWGTSWNPVKEEYGALPFIYGSVVSSILALSIAVPLGLGSAIFISELSPRWLRNPVSFVIELLAAIPSIVYGVWGLFVLVPLVRNYLQPFLATYLGFLPLFQGAMYGVGMLAAGIILAIMILPTITSISRDVIYNVPTDQREAMLAVGATRWETIWHAVLPYSRTGLFGAVMLGLGRAIGETMAVTMVIGNKHNISLSLFKPANTMASLIANEFAEAVSPLYTGVLIEIGLILFAITVLLNIIARWMIWQFSVNGKRVGAGPNV
ncbi:MAG: phosphate ABC transporter permease subunit PstC [Bacillota bacterium]